jgi:nitrogen regulatory protein PII
MQRIDFFVSEREVDRVCQALRKAGAPGWSVMRHVTGSGEGGEISESMDFSGLGANAHIVIFCEVTQLEPLRQLVQPILRRFGGVGFVSSAERF